MGALAGSLDVLAFTHDFASFYLHRVQNVEYFPQNRHIRQNWNLSAVFRRFFGFFSAWGGKSTFFGIFGKFPDFVSDLADFGVWAGFDASIRSNLGKYRKSEPQSLTFRFLADLRDLTHPGVG
jgi:hypothetical protein